MGSWKDNNLLGIKCYHGSDSKFNKFNLDYVGKNSSLNKGIFFSEDKEVAKTYGNYVTEWTIYPQNMITVDFENSSHCYLFEQEYTPSELVKVINQLNEQMRENCYLSVKGYQKYVDLEDEDIEGEIELPSDYMNDLIKEELESYGWDEYEGEIDCIKMINIKDGFDIWDSKISTNYVVLDENIIRN